MRTAALARDFVGNVYMPVYWGDLGTTIMRLDTAGGMTLIAGGGESLVAGVPALEFALPDILGLAIDPHTGALLIRGSDSKVYRVPGVAAPQV